MKKSHFNCKFTWDEERQICLEYRDGATKKELLEKYRVGRRAINGVLERQKEPRRYIVTSLQEQEIIAKFENGLSPQKIGTLYGVSRAAIIDVLARNSISSRPNRIHPIRHNAFDSLKDEHTLYWLGFIYADGYVSKRELKIGLAIKDIEQLHKLKAFMASTVNVTIRGTSCHIGFASTVLTKQLKSLGIVPRRGKFHLLQSQMLNNLEHHFIRGYLDGDGCISTNEQVVFLGQKDILQWIRDVLHQEVSASLTKIRKRRGIYEVSWGGIAQAKRIVSYIYQDASIWMKRKKDIADNWRK